MTSQQQQDNYEYSDCSSYYECSTPSKTSKCLWMGNVSAAMTDEFIRSAFGDFAKFIVDISIKPAKEHHPYGYAFVQFSSDKAAATAKRSLNGTQPFTDNSFTFKLDIRHTGPPARRRWSSYGTDSREESPNSNSDATMYNEPRNYSGRNNNYQKGWTAFVGGIDETVTDEMLGDAFKTSYPSVFEAIVIKTFNGNRGFGFVRFKDEAEFLEALGQSDTMSNRLHCNVRIDRAHKKRSHYPYVNGTQSPQSTSRIYINQAQIGNGNEMVAVTATAPSSARQDENFNSALQNGDISSPPATNHADSSMPRQFSYPQVYSYPGPFVYFPSQSSLPIPQGVGPANAYVYYPTFQPVANPEYFTPPFVTPILPLQQQPLTNVPSGQ